jgi:hypothetical protein
MPEKVQQPSKFKTIFLQENADVLRGTRGIYFQGGMYNKKKAWNKVQRPGVYKPPFSLPMVKNGSRIVKVSPSD